MMKMIVEQVVEISTVKKKIKKVRLSTMEVELLPVAVGDDLWFINTEERNQRSRLITLDIRMAVSEDGLYAIIDVIAPELLEKYSFDRKMYARYMTDNEEQAPDSVELEPAAQAS